MYVIMLVSQQWTCYLTNVYGKFHFTAIKSFMLAFDMVKFGGFDACRDYFVCMSNYLCKCVTTFKTLDRLWKLQIMEGS